MPRKPSPHPTEVELQILSVLWEQGPCTVREVHGALQPRRETGYSTTLKMMQVMTNKGLLSKDESKRPQVYRPTMPREQAQTQFVDDLIQRVFGGAAEQLIQRAISSRHVSERDLEQIKQLLSKLEGDAK